MTLVILAFVTVLGVIVAWERFSGPDASIRLVEARGVAELGVLNCFDDDSSPAAIWQATYPLDQYPAWPARLCVRQDPRS